LRGDEVYICEVLVESLQQINISTAELWGTQAHLGKGAALIYDEHVADA
jgi:hypothetical protein